MADNPVEVRDLDIEVTGPGMEHFKVNEIILSNAVNALPSCVVRGVRAVNAQVGLMSGTTSIKSFSLEETSRSLARDHSNMWADGDAKKLKVTVHDDGMGHQMEFEGISSAPGLKVNAGKIGEQRTIIHPDQQISGINLSIYTLKDETGNSSSLPLDEIDPLSEDTVAHHIDSMIKFNIDETKNEYKGKSQGINPELQDAHDNNKKIYDSILSKILNGSVDTKLGWADRANEILAGNFQYMNSISQVLGQSTNYLTTQNSYLCPSFLFTYICGFDNGEGDSRLFHSQVNAGKGSSYYVEADVDLISLNYNMGNTGELALGQIILTTNIMGRYGDLSETGHGAGTSSGQVSKAMPLNGMWPPQKIPKHGDTRTIMMPRWMEHQYAPAQPGQINAGLDGQPAPRDPDVNAQAGIDKLAEKHDGRIEGTTEFLKLWAQKHYVQQALQNHTCSIQIPLDIRWGCSRPSPLPVGNLQDATAGGGRPVGLVYKVSANNYKEGQSKVFLFEGYLQSVTHEVSVGEAQGRATTHLVFSHVKGVGWDGFDPAYGTGPWVAPITT